MTDKHLHGRCPGCCMTADRCVCHLEGKPCREDIDACTPGRPPTPEQLLSQDPDAVKSRESYRRRKARRAARLAGDNSLTSEDGSVTLEPRKGCVLTTARKLLAVLFALIPASLSAAPLYSPKPLYMPFGSMPLFQVVVTSPGGGGGGPITIGFNDDVPLTFGTGTDTAITYNTVQTPDSWFFGVGTDSRAIIIAEQADAAFDFAHAQATHPTVYFHSAAQSTTQFGAVTHDGSNFKLISGSNNIMMSSTGADLLFISDTGAYVGVNIGSAEQYAWGSTSGPSSTPDTFLTRDAAATVQMGKDVNGAAVAQTLKGHDGITGTNILGASLNLKSGLGTGLAATIPVTVHRIMEKATGTTAQTYSPAFMACPAMILSNTSATAQTIATITTTSTTAGSVTMDYAVTANNGTVQDQDSGVVKVSWNNNAGTVAAAMTAVVLQSDSDASGTLATTPTVTVATNVVSIKFTPTWVTIVPTSVFGYATFTIHSSTPSDVIVCQ